MVIDYHNTLEFHDTIDFHSLKRLKDEGVKVWVISYGGPKRNRETEGFLQPFMEDHLVDHLSFTRSKSGWEGKAQLMKSFKVDTIFDDSPEVCNEAEMMGMEVYRVGWQPGHKTWRSLADAVEGFLDEHAPNF